SPGRSHHPPFREKPAPRGSRPSARGRSPEATYGVQPQGVGFQAGLPAAGALVLQ
ncbi:hypothetical protein P7K49_032356, partial [Saguinus oedipus]